MLGEDLIIDDYHKRAARGLADVLLEKTRSGKRQLPVRT